MSELEVSAEDVTIKDLFSQRQLESEDYDPELAAMYCQYIMEGKSLMSAAAWVNASETGSDEEYDMSDPVQRYQFNQTGRSWYKRFQRWRIKFKKFDDMVNLALKERCYAFVEEMVEIADDATDDAIMGAQGPTVNGKAIRRAELMINTRKFVAAKLLPKVFGDKTQMELTGADGKDLVPTTFNIGLIPSGSFVTADEAQQSTEEN